MSNNKVLKDAEDFRQRDNFIKQQQQLKAMKPTSSNKVLSADSMIEDLLSKKETFQKKRDTTSNNNKIQREPPWLNPDNQAAVHPLYIKIWNLVKVQAPPSVGGTSPNLKELADTAVLSTLLMTSGLSTDMLGFIWSLANNTVPGVLTQVELYSVLALIALAQSGYIFNNISVLYQLPQPPLPKLDLSVVIQLKTNFATPASTVQMHQPSMMMQLPVKSGQVTTTGVTNELFMTNPTSNYFTNVQPVVSELKTAPAGIVPLDVNNLQSASVLTLPNSFNMNPGPSPSQQLNLGISSLPTNGSSMMSGQNFNGIPNQISSPTVSVNNAIPSISLGLSSPTSHSMGALLPNVYQQPNEILTSTGGTNASSFQDPLSATFMGGLPQTSNNLFASNEPDINSKFSDLNLVDNLKVQNKTTDSSKVTNKVDEDDSFNIDESFDSLCTERAISNSLSTNGNKSTAVGFSSNSITAPNYNIDLFDSYNDVKQIFPESSNRSSALEFTDKSVIKSDDVKVNEDNISESNLVMHNPIYSNDDNIDDLSKFKIKINSNFDTNLTVSNVISTVDDDFTDFQSADFNAFNNVSTAENNKKIESNIIADSGDNFTDFQQATSIDSVNNISPNVSLKAFDNLVEKRINDISDDDLFPGFKIDLNLSSTLAIKSNDNISDKSINVIDNCENDENSTNISKSTSNSDFNVSDNFSHDKNDVKNDQTTSSVFGANSLTEQAGDKYSALRMLEVSSFTDTISSISDVNNGDNNVNDDFGDFVAADTIMTSSDPGQLQLPDVSTISPSSTADDTSVQVKCLEACLGILQKSYNLLSSASTPHVLNQVLTDPRGSAHLTCLLEVYKVSERLMQHVDSSSSPLVEQVQSVWNSIIPYVDGSKHKQMEETVGPVCGLCKCNYGPSPVRYGLNTFHAPCANLYLHYVNPVLPTVTN